MECSALETLILRNTAGVCSLGANVFDGSGVASGAGYIYVPSALVDQYKAAVGWSTYASQIRAIEDYPEIPGMVDYSVTSIADNAFEGTGIVDATFPNCESVGNYAFRNCESLINADFPAAVSVGWCAFQNCSNLVAANFPVATTIGHTAFQNCACLTTVNCPEVTAINSTTFFGCTSLKVARFQKCKSLGGSAFYRCKSLTMVDIPNATDIGKEAFRDCSVLETVNIPSAKSIGANVFRDCAALKTLLLCNTEAVCSLSDYTFWGTPIEDGTGYIYVPRALVDSYKTATNWSTYASQIRALEDYTVDGTTTGALDESKI